MDTTNQENQKIKLIDKKQETKNIYTFIFEKPKNLSWQAGQYAIFNIPNLKTKERTSRAFSICSTKDENCIMFSTKISTPSSDFKKYLMSIKPNNEIEIKHPTGEFTINENSKQIIGIAGGIGITPFRAILKEITNNKTKYKNTKLTLIYSDTEQNYAFKTELEQYNKQENINIKFTSTIDDANKEINNCANKHKNNADYFISGPPKMVEAIQEILKQKQITNIKHDSFFGY